MDQYTRMTTTSTDPVKPKWNTRQLAFSSFIHCAFTRFGLDWAGKTPQTIPPPERRQKPRKRFNNKDDNETRGTTDK